MLSKWVETKPYIGIIASISGFGASVLSILQYLSVILGFMGALLGLAAGYYTWQIKRDHWKQIQLHRHHNH